MHRVKGRHPLSQVGQKIAVEILRAMADNEREKVHAADGLAILAGRLQRQRFLHPAELMLQEALAIDPDHGEALSALAAIHERSDRSKDAAEALDHLLTLRPDDGHARVRLAVAHRRQGDFEKALEELDTVQRRASDSSTGIWWQVLAHPRRGASAGRSWPPGRSRSRFDGRARAVSRRPRAAAGSTLAAVPQGRS